MKKRIYLLLLSVIVIFSSCKDKKNEFAEQIFTNEQISAALLECITITTNNTLNTLCNVDTIINTNSFYNYESGTYRIELPAAAAAMIDALIENGYAERIDSLIFNINKAASSCGNNLKIQFLEPLIKSTTFTNPGAVLRGGNTAVTDYVKKTSHAEFINALVSFSLVETFTKLQITSDWNMLQNTYREITGNYSSIDILNHSAQQFVNQFFKKMAIEEDAVRKNPGAYSNTGGLFYRVFSIL